MKYLLILITLLLFTNCAQKETPTFTIEGHIENPVRSFIVLTQESDIERQESVFIDTLYLDKSGNFKTDFKEEPHFYNLAINDEVVVPLVLDKGQIVRIEVNSTETKITGSKDTDLYMEYESFRAESLERLVKTVRRAITDESQN